MNQSKNNLALNRGDFKNGDLYICLSDTNLDWFIEDVLEFMRLWNEQYHLEQIAEFFKRSQFECFLLYIDLVEADKIKTRKYGLWHEKYIPTNDEKTETEF